jgi:hypothetical protein
MVMSPSSKDSSELHSVPKRKSIRVNTIHRIRFVADMKLAHYMHIAPRLLFVAQGLATLIGAIVQCGVTVFMITRIDGVCTPEAEGNFICPHGKVTYSSSLIWGEFHIIVDVLPGHKANQPSGAVGPGRLFSSGQIYSNLLWFFLVGPAAVVITYLLGRRWKAVNYISWPVAFGAMSMVPPATGISFSSWWIVNLIFNGVLRRRKPAWWSKYSMFIVSPSSLPLLLTARRLCVIRRARLRRCSRDGNHLLLHNSSGRFVGLVGKYRVENNSRRQRHALPGVTSAWLLWAPEGNLGVISNA